MSSSYAGTIEPSESYTCEQSEVACADDEIYLSYLQNHFTLYELTRSHRQLSQPCLCAIRARAQTAGLAHSRARAYAWAALIHNHESQISNDYSRSDNECTHYNSSSSSSSNNNCSRSITSSAPILSRVSSPFTAATPHVSQKDWVEKCNVDNDEEEIDVPGCLATPMSHTSSSSNRDSDEDETHTDKSESHRIKTSENHESSQHSHSNRDNNIHCTQNDTHTNNDSNIKEHDRAGEADSDGSATMRTIAGSTTHVSSYQTRTTASSSSTPPPPVYREVFDSIHTANAPAPALRHHVLVQDDGTREEDMNNHTQSDSVHSDSEQNDKEKEKEENENNLITHTSCVNSSNASCHTVAQSPAPLSSVKSDPPSSSSHSSSTALSLPPMRILDADISRSLWTWYPNERERTRMRHTLRDIMIRTLHPHGKPYHYYQGMHELVGFLMYVLYSDEKSRTDNDEDDKATRRKCMRTTNDVADQTQHHTGLKKHIINDASNNDPDGVTNEHYSNNHDHLHDTIQTSTTHDSPKLHETPTASDTNAHDTQDTHSLLRDMDAHTHTDNHVSYIPLSGTPMTGDTVTPIATHMLRTTKSHTRLTHSCNDAHEKTKPDETDDTHDTDIICATVSLSRTLLHTHWHSFAAAELRPSQALLYAVHAILAAEDGALARALEHSGVAPDTHYAVSWIITWYTHVLTNVHVLTRLWDYFISHGDELAVVYFTAALVLHARASIMQSIAQARRTVNKSVYSGPTTSKADGIKDNDDDDDGGNGKMEDVCDAFGAEESCPVEVMAAVYTELVRLPMRVLETARAAQLDELCAHATRLRRRHEIRVALARDAFMRGRGGYGLGCFLGRRPARQRFVCSGNGYRGSGGGFGCAVCRRKGGRRGGCW